MNNKLQKYFETLLPFLILGIFIAISISLLFVFSYILVWGLLIGAVIWIVMTTLQFFFKKDKSPPPKKQGRIIEHDHKK